MTKRTSGMSRFSCFREMDVPCGYPSPFIGARGSHRRQEPKGGTLLRLPPPKSGAATASMPGWLSSRIAGQDFAAEQTALGEAVAHELMQPRK